MPATYMTSFHLPPGNERELVELARAFPPVTLLRGGAAGPAAQHPRAGLAGGGVRTAVRAGGGLAVLFAGLQATLDERIRQGALLRALGAERRLLLRARRAEFDCSALPAACSPRLAANR